MEENNINLQPLLDNFKAELEKQFNEIFGNKNIDKSIISKELDKFKKLSFENINKELEKIARDHNDKSIDNIKKILDQNKEKYLNEFNVISQSFINQSNKQQQQIDSSNTAVVAQQQNINKEIENIKKLQIKTVKQFEDKKTNLENIIKKRSNPIAKASIIKDKKTNDQSSKLVKTITTLLQTFETKSIKRKESQERTTKMIIEKQKISPTVVDNDKQKEMQESSIAEHNEANMEQVDSESSDVMADMKGDIDKLSNEQKETEKKKKEYDFTSEKGWATWLADVTIDIIKTGSMFVVAGGMEFWDWLTGESKKVEEQTASLDTESDKVIESVKKENEALIEKEESSAEGDIIPEIQTDDLNKLSKDADELLKQHDKENQSSEQTEDSTEEKSIVAEVDKMTKDAKEDVIDSSPATPSAEIAKLPSMGLKGSPQPSQVDPIQQQSESIVNVEQNNIESKQKQIEDDGTKQFKDSIDQSKQSSQLEKPTVEEPKDINIEQNKPIESAETTPSITAESLDQTSFDGFNVEDLMSQQTTVEISPEDIEKQIMKTQSSEENIIHAKEVKIQSEDVSKKDNVSKQIKQDQITSTLKESIKQENNIVVNNKLEKVNEEIKQQQLIIQSVKPMENKSTIINEQTFLLDDFYGLLNEMTSTIDALSKTIEGQKK